MKIIDQTLAKNLTLDLLDQYGLKKKQLHVKNDKSNLHAMATTLKCFISIEDLNLEENFQKICFGHDFFKAC